MLIFVTIGEALRKARAATKQEVVAEALGVDQPTVSRWESDKTRPSLEQINAFEKAVGRPKGFCLIAAGYVEVPKTAREAIEADPSLEPGQRKVVLGAYDSAVTIVKAPHHGSEVTQLRPADSADDPTVLAAAVAGQLGQLSPDERRHVERLVDEMLGEG